MNVFFDSLILGIFSINLNKFYTKIVQLNLHNQKGFVFENLCLIQIHLSNKDDADVTQCIVCYQVLGIDSLNPAKLKVHLSKCHPTLVQKNKSYFKRHLSLFKRQHLDSFGTYSTIKGQPMQFVLHTLLHTK